MSKTTISHIETLHNGYRFRSRTEARWAVFFEAAGIRFEYEKEGFNLETGRYLPDFYLPDLKLWLEVKGETPTGREVRFCMDLHRATGQTVLLAVGAPKECGQIIAFPLILNPQESLGDDGTIQPRLYFADDRRNAGEFWLVSEDDDAAFSIGSQTGPDHGKYPCVHSATKRGYAAARAVRFEFSR